ncbi:caffeoyl-CoA O-methyltransferase [Saccharopolyspora lacisalsi]|uniref:Caffeoyl-CoA O-methyltransferase n=1 Tax=Halosaccharopolyspora lacisalsi TaxID=1000566 RepID=A0A839DZB5_9PSEU|nr:O-methyltransferase [Halosaccharopolyspora lacisalsi]MBA8824561.1 caffeoyl-CoA O-methyltransferase [Halosaccharopolyspora lacisalsi]
MARKTAQLDSELHEYLVEHGTQPDEVQRELIAETERQFPDRARMRISPEQGSLLTLLTKIARTRFAVEVGTFTGYSALAVARGLDEHGRLLCCDTSTEYTAIAHDHWERAGVRHLIDLRLGSAIETLSALPEQPSIDLAFIDADKTEYVDYWEEIVVRTRPGGLILVDNVLAGGHVVGPDYGDADIRAIRAFNEHALHDERVELTMLPVGDGLTLARRR